MKRRNLFLITMLLLFTVLSACSQSSSQHAVVTVRGINFDLSQDFADIVSEFNENEVSVYSLYYMLEEYYIDENGNLIKDNLNFNSYEYMVFGENLPLSKRSVYFSFSDEQNHPEEKILMQKSFAFLYDTEYQSFEGIHNGSALKDVEALEGYTKCPAFFWSDNECSGALYVDGKRVDLSKYKSKFNDWLNEYEQNGLRASMETEFVQLQHSYIVLEPLLSDRAITCSDFNELVAFCEEINYPLEESIIIAYALQDAGAKLEDGKIDSYSIIRYEERSDCGMVMLYDEFYFEK